MIETRLLILKPTAKDISRFKGKLDVNAVTGCWLWTGPLAKGYGRFAISKDRQVFQLPAHRLAYFIATGIDPVGFLVLHRCDTPRCCNPRHLFLGTPQDNVNDCAAKGRAKFASGIEHYNAILTEEDVKEIRGLLLFGLSCAAIARQFRTCTSNISQIKRNESWKGIK